MSEDEAVDGQDPGDEAGDTGEQAAPPDPDAGPPVSYEIVYDCRDRMLGSRLAQRLEDVARPAWPAERTEDGPTWAITIEFSSRPAADEFFSSDFYRQFCIEARRSCRSSVLVVPLGTVEAEPPAAAPPPAGTASTAQRPGSRPGGSRGPRGRPGSR